MSPLPQGRPIVVFSTLATQAALPAIVDRYTEATGIAVEATFAPTTALMARIDEGEVPALAILTAEGVDKLDKEGRLVRAAPVAISRVGLAVKAGASKPDISSVAALRDALSSARSIAYSKIGASGLFFADLIRRLGIEDEVRAKATIIPSGFTAELAADGRVELAIQQISELLLVPGIDVVGPMPDELGSASVFSAGVFPGPHAAEAERLLAELVSSAAHPDLVRSGLAPVAR
jgi:molybdate transport system substrate-binding protein